MENQLNVYAFTLLLLALVLQQFLNDFLYVGDEHILGCQQVGVVELGNNDFVQLNPKFSLHEENSFVHYLLGPSHLMLKE